MELLRSLKRTALNWSSEFDFVANTLVALEVVARVSTMTYDPLKNSPFGMVALPTLRRVDPVQAYPLAVHLNGIAVDHRDGSWWGCRSWALLKRKRPQFLRALIETVSQTGTQPGNWII